MSNKLHLALQTYDQIENLSFLQLSVKEFLAGYNSCGNPLPI